MTQEIVDRLDQLIGLYQLANSEVITQARDRLRADDVVAKLLDETEDWTPTGALKAKVAITTGVSEKTVQRRISELVDQKILLATGSGANRSVKSGGLI
jgi:DNA-binding Lrp family transcriptional regulator